MTAAPPRDAAPAISVVIPHYNDLKNLDHCLTLLQRQDFALSFETIVVDNKSAPPWSDIVAAVAGRATLISCEEKGAGPARNAGVAAARADRLAFIDSDCTPEAGWLAAGFAALDRLDFVGGRVKVEVRDPGRMTPVEAFETVFAFNFKDYIEKKKFTGTGNLFARRAVFDAVGGFKAEVSEDVEWSHRAQAGGFKLGYEPRAIVGHPARVQWADLERKWTRMNAEGFALARSRRLGVLRLVLRSWIVLLSIGPHAAKIWRSPRLPHRRDRIGAIGVLARLRLFRFAAAHKAVWSMLRAAPK